MSSFARAILGAAAFGAFVSLAPLSPQAIAMGIKSLPRVDGSILVRRECIAWDRDENGRMRCVRWAECSPGSNVC
jgi:hypothetical protein